MFVISINFQEIVDNEARDGITKRNHEFVKSGVKTRKEAFDFIEECKGEFFKATTKSFRGVKDEAE
jgi:hypothetical protein